MYKYILEQAGNINWMAIFALLTFVFIFAVSIIMVFFRGKSWADRMANMPLDGNDSFTGSSTSKHEQ